MACNHQECVGEEITNTDHLNSVSPSGSATTSSESSTSDNSVTLTNDKKIQKNAKPHTCLPKKEKEEEEDVAEKEAHTILPEYFKLLVTGLNTDGDTNVSLDSKPDWLDMEKFRRGQKFAQEYLFGIVFAEMLSLALLFSHPSNIIPLMYSKNSDTPFKSFKRYLSTVSRVKSWYEGDPWKHDDMARRNFKIVRALHKKYRTQLNNPDANNIDQSSLHLSIPLWCDSIDFLKDDFCSSCPVPAIGQCPFVTEKSLFINQTDMAMTQFGFVGLIILYPESFGAYWASDEDLEGFLHLWRVIGYMLGIGDRYNFCAGDLATVRRRSQDAIALWMKPSLRGVNCEWEHMLRCVVEGISYYIPGLNFETSLLYLCRLLDVSVPRFEASLTWRHRVMYYIMSFVMCILLRLSSYRAFSNWLLNRSIKRAQNASQTWLREHEERTYSYQQQRESFYTRL